ncbi:hypothetical protein BOX15_Mlig021188g5, partial [Macrostomum lignano]
KACSQSRIPSTIEMALPDPRLVSERVQLIRSDFIYIYDVNTESMAAEVAGCLGIYIQSVLAEYPLADKPCNGPWKFVLCDVMPELRLMLLLNTVNKTGAKIKILYLETSSGCAPTNAERLDLILMYNLPENKERFLSSVPIPRDQIYFSPNASAEFAAGCCFVERVSWMQPKQLETLASTLGVEINYLWVEKGEPPFYSEDTRLGRSTLDFEPQFSLAPTVSFSIQSSDGSAKMRPNKRPASSDFFEHDHDSAKRTVSSDAAVTTDDMDNAFRSEKLLPPASPFRDSSDSESDELLPVLGPTVTNSEAGTNMPGFSGRVANSAMASAYTEPTLFSKGTIYVSGSELLQIWAHDGPFRPTLKTENKPVQNSLKAFVVNSPIRHWVLSPFKAELEDERIRDGVIGCLDNVDQVLVLPYLDEKENIRKRVIFTERTPDYRTIHSRLQTLSNSLGLSGVLSSSRLSFECLHAESPHPDRQKHPNSAFWVPLSSSSAEKLQCEFLLLTNVQSCTSQHVDTYLKTRFAQADCFHMVTVKAQTYAIIKFKTYAECLQTYMAMQFRGGASSAHYVCQYDYLSLVDGRLRLPSHDFLYWVQTIPKGSGAAKAESAGFVPPCNCHPTKDFLRVTHQPSLHNLVERITNTLGAFNIDPVKASTALVVRTAELLFDPDKAIFKDGESVRNFYSLLGNEDLAFSSINCSEHGVVVPGIAYRLKWILTGEMVSRKPLPRGKNYRIVSSPIRHWFISNLKQGFSDQRIETAIMKALVRVDQLLIYQLPSNQFGLQKCVVFTEAEPSYQEMRNRIIKASSTLVAFSNSTSVEYQARMSEDPNIEPSAFVHWVPLSFETAQEMQTQFLFVSGFQPSRTSGLVVVNYFASFLPNALSIYVPCHLDKSLDYAVLRFANWEYCSDAYRYLMANADTTGVHGRLVCMLDYVEIGDSVLRVPCHNLLPWYEASSTPFNIKSLALLPLDKSDFNCSCHPQANCLRQCISKDQLQLVATCALNWAATPKKVKTVNQCVIDMLRSKAVY